MPAARTVGSSFADVSEEALGLGWVHQSPHPWGEAALGPAGWGLYPGPSWKGPRGLSLRSSEIALLGGGPSPAL